MRVFELVNQRGDTYQNVFQNIREVKILYGRPTLPVTVLLLISGLLSGSGFLLSSTDDLWHVLQHAFGECAISKAPFWYMTEVTGAMELALRML